MGQTEPTIAHMLKRYRDAADKTNNRDPSITNMWVDELRSWYKRLRETEEGRTAMTTLLTDASPDVRGWAATHVLSWAPEIARPVLENLRDSKGRRSFDAEIVLREFDKGRLSFDT